MRDPFSKVCSAARQPDSCWHQLSSFTVMEMFHSAKHHYCFHYISSPYTYCAEWLIQENWTVAWTGKFFTCYLHIWSFTIIPTQKNVELRLQLIFRIRTDLGWHFILNIHSTAQKTISDLVSESWDSAHQFLSWGLQQTTPVPSNPWLAG